MGKAFYKKKKRKEDCVGERNSYRTFIHNSDTLRKKRAINKNLANMYMRSDTNTFAHLHICTFAFIEGNIKRAYFLVLLLCTELFS